MFWLMDYISGKEINSNNKTNNNTGSVYTILNQDINTVMLHKYKI